MLTDCQKAGPEWSVFSKWLLRVGPEEVELFGGSPPLELLVLNGAVDLIRKCLQLVGRRLEIHPKD